MTNIQAVDIINSYLWNQLSERINLQLIGGLVPFVPSQDSLEFSTAKTPFIVYSWSTRPDYDTYFQNIDTIVYTISDVSLAALKNVQNEIFNLFKREDDAATDINSYIHSTFSSTAVQSQFDIKNVRVLTSTSPEPAEDKGERSYSQIVISCRYTIVLDNSGLRAE